MYATCLFCHSPLGANESIEHFPVGKRLAFDAAKGRLWVVCGKCERWNLSPLDERWEAIEESERAYRDTKKRVATDNVGLARLDDGTELIRIGAPLRPEFAAWRYGDTFGRRRRNRIIAGSAIAAGGAAMVGGLTLSFGSLIASGAMMPSLVMLGFSLRNVGAQWVPRLRVVANDGAIIRVSAETIRRSTHIAVGDADTQESAQLSVSLVATTSSIPRPKLQYKNISFRNRTERLTGRHAQVALAQILAVKNSRTGSLKDLAAALPLIEQASGPGALMRALPLARFQPRLQRYMKLPSTIISIGSLPAYARLALEMSLHEDAERRALEGELHELERRWKEAEEIAAISDSLFLPDQSTNSEQK